MAETVTVELKKSELRFIVNVLKAVTTLLGDLLPGTLSQEGLAELTRKLETKL